MDLFSYFIVHSLVFRIVQFVAPSFAYRQIYVHNNWFAWWMIKNVPWQCFLFITRRSLASDRNYYITKDVFWKYHVGIKLNVIFNHFPAFS